MELPPVLPILLLHEANRQPVITIHLQHVKVLTELSAPIQEHALRLLFQQIITIPEAVRPDHILLQRVLQTVVLLPEIIAAAVLLHVLHQEAVVVVPLLPIAEVVLHLHQVEAFLQEVEVAVAAVAVEAVVLHRVAAVVEDKNILKFLL